MRDGEIRQFCILQDESQSLMQAAMSQMNLSARAYHRILKLACLIADLTGCGDIGSPPLADALNYCLQWRKAEPARKSFGATPAIPQPHVLHGS